MSVAGSLERAWAVLGPPPPDSELSSFPLDVTANDEPCRAALDRAGARHLLIPARTELIATDSRPSVLAVALRKLEFGAAIETYVDLSCAEENLHREFDDVIADILESIDGAEFPAATALQSITRWRRLFRSRLVLGLSPQQRVGLFAELSMLSAFLQVDDDFPIEAWRGPLMEPHDFEAPAGCVEVKGLSPSNDEVVVHGLAQMDTHDGRSLDLVLVSVVSDADGTSLRDLVEDLVERTHSSATLLTRLAAAGWQVDNAGPETDAYSIGEVVGIRVGPTTPRVVASSLLLHALPAGVGNVSYHVSRSALRAVASEASLTGVAEGMR